MHADRTLIQVFAKAPVPGRVKTRLIPHIGAHAATELYCRLLRRALATAAIARVGSIELWSTAPADSPVLQRFRCTTPNCWQRLGTGPSNFSVRWPAGR